MVEVDCTTARPGGVTLVAVRLDNRVAAPGVDAHRVRLRSNVDGPTWPPRVEGVPAAPWDGDEATVVVPTGRVGSLGFASPAPPADPPVEVLEVAPADGADADESIADGDLRVDDVLRVLGDPTPPRDAVAPREESFTDDADPDRPAGRAPAGGNVRSADADAPAADTGVPAADTDVPAASADAPPAPEDGS